MQIKFKIIIFGISLFLLSTFFAYADEDRNPLESSYLFFLYYDNGKLSTDRDFEFKYDIIPEKFVPEVSADQLNYKGEILNIKGDVSSTFMFNVSQGKLSIKAPYVADGSRVDFYNPDGQLLLSLAVQESAICNDNNLCEADTGEDAQNCSLDCGSTSLTTSDSPIPQDNSDSSGLWFGIVYTVLGLIIIGVYLLIRRHSNALPPN